MQVRDRRQRWDVEAETALGLRGGGGGGRLLAFEEVEGLGADVHEALY
jgi:hypothetical protein